MMSISVTAHHAPPSTRPKQKISGSGRAAAQSRDEPVPCSARPDITIATASAAAIREIHTESAADRVAKAAGSAVAVTAEKVAIIKSPER